MLLFCEAVVFLMAAFVHAGMWIDGYRHREARIAETVLAGALYVGLGLSWLHPLWTRKARPRDSGICAVRDSHWDVHDHRRGRAADKSGHSLSPLHGRPFVMGASLYHPRTHRPERKSRTAMFPARRIRCFMSIGITARLLMNGKRDRSHKLFSNNGGSDEEQSHMV